MHRNVKSLFDLIDLFTVFYSLTCIANSLCMVSKDTNINDLREKDSGYIKYLLFGLANYINLFRFNRFIYIFK